MTVAPYSGASAVLGDLGVEGRVFWSEADPHHETATIGYVTTDGDTAMTVHVVWVDGRVRVVGFDAGWPVT